MVKLIVQEATHELSLGHGALCTMEGQTQRCRANGFLGNTGGEKLDLSLLDLMLIYIYYTYYIIICENILRISYTFREKTHPQM